MLFKKKPPLKPPQEIYDDPIAYFGKNYSWDTFFMGAGSTLALKPEEQAAYSLTPNSGYTPFPKPEFKLRLIYESEKNFVEESYYWMLHFIRHGGGGIPAVKKVLDTFSASVQSSVFGVTEQRLAIQQDRAGQYLRTIAEMSKGLPPIIRELRVIDERLSFYEDTFANPNAKSSDHALKGLWIDMVEGGAKNPASVYGMSQQLSMVTLPDLFFQTRIDEGAFKGKSGIAYEQEAQKIGLRVDKAVESLKFNEKVKEVLKRKLIQFYTWKYRTYVEFKQRRTFLLKYLRQHYNTIQLYAEWLKPYMMNVKRLSQNQKNMNSPEMVSAFETSVLELELFGEIPQGDYSGAVSVHLKYVTQPQLSYVAEGYQRGPQHNGRMELTIRAYGMTKKEVELYVQMRSQETMDLLKEHDQTIAGVLDALGDDLKEYLKESGENIVTDRDKELDRRKAAAGESFRSDDSILSSFKDLGAGFKEIGSAFGANDVFKNAPKTLSADDLTSGRAKAAAGASKKAYLIYNIYKKSHRFMTP